MQRTNIGEWSFHTVLMIELSCNNSPRGSCDPNKNAFAKRRAFGLLDASNSGCNTPTSSTSSLQFNRQTLSSTTPAKNALLTTQKRAIHLGDFRPRREWRLVTAFHKQP